MYNILLDRYPSEYEGYLIRTDFRIGIQLVTVLEDYELDEESRLLKAFELLYGNGVPDDLYLALNGLKWFTSGGSTKFDSYETSDVDDALEDVVTEDTSTNIAFDFDIDAQLICAAMQSQYNITLDSTYMHWFKFLALFKGLKDTQLNEVMYYRTVDIDKLPKTQRSEMRKLQNKLKIHKVTASRKAELIAVFGEDDWKNHI